MPDKNPNENTEGKDWSNYHSLAPFSEEEREAKAKELLEWIEHNKKYYGESKEEFERGQKYYKKVMRYRYRDPSEVIKLIIKVILIVILNAFALAAILLPMYLLYSVFPHLIEWLWLYLKK